MPELPEVETIVQALRKGSRNSLPLLGRNLKSVELLWERSLAEPTPSVFREKIPGQTITRINRRGKFILVQLTRNTLLIHLRMSGNLRVESAYNEQEQLLPLQKHDRVIFYFIDGLRLVFNNPRKFGRIWLVKDPQTVLANLGPEPLDQSFSGEDLCRQLQSRRRQLKPLLLDQSFIAGLGNIYTDEALHLARLHPRQIANRLSTEEANRLLKAIRQVLTDGIHHKGASIDWAYRGGNYQNQFRVYHRAGEPCPLCGQAIERFRLGQRSTFYCPKCQSI